MLPMRKKEVVAVIYKTQSREENKCPIKAGESRRKKRLHFSFCSICFI